MHLTYEQLAVWLESRPEDDDEQLFASRIPDDCGEPEPTTQCGNCPRHECDGEGGCQLPYLPTYDFADDPIVIDDEDYPIIFPDAPEGGSA